MKDPEFIQLRNRFLFAILIVLVFAIPIIIFLNKTYSDTDVLARIKKNDSFVILIEKKDCKLCNSVNKVLDNNSVDYVRLNRDKNKDYEFVLKRLELINKREEYPIVVIVSNGKMSANLFGISTVDEVLEFIKNNGLVNSK